MAQITVFEAAVSHQTGTSILSNRSSSLGARLSEDHQQDSIAVPVIALDDVLENPYHLPPPTVIKIDAEGAETAVLRGMTSILEKVRPVLICEVHEVGAASDLRAAFARMLGPSLSKYHLTILEEAVEGSKRLWAPHVLATPVAGPSKQIYP
jgi:hypothetical protein